jgi:aspartate aminotransferase-like enzyme
MPGLLPNVDPDGLLEYSVVYTDRALNHMSQKFQGVMRDISSVLKEVYHARSAVVVPGSGSFGMEAVARQFAGGKKTLIVRNGWFSYRWTQILDMGQIASEQLVLKARPVATGRQAAFAPAPIAEVVAAIQATAARCGVCPARRNRRRPAPARRLPACDGRCRARRGRPAGAGLHCQRRAVGGHAGHGVDVLVSAPQKGWSGSPCCAFVMLSERARTAIDATTSSSFAADLKKWLQIMETYESGGHAYHTTLPTDALTVTRDVMLESRAYGFEKLRAEQWDMGRKVRAMLAATASRAWPPKASRRRAWW